MGKLVVFIFSKIVQALIKIASWIKGLIKE